jgi:hypothetical protein
MQLLREPANDAGSSGFEELNDESNAA